MTKSIDYQTIIANYLKAFKKANGFKVDFSLEYLKGRFVVKYHDGETYSYTSAQILDMTQVLYLRAKYKEMENGQQPAN